MFENILNDARVFVFREIEKNGLIYFEHFEATDDGTQIVPAQLLTETEHLMRLTYE